MTLASDAKKIFRAGVSAVEPSRAVQSHLRRQGAKVIVGTRPFRLEPPGSVRLVAIGKAAGAMVDAAAKVVGPRFEGLALTPVGFPGSRAGVRVRFGDHPVPGPNSFRAGAALLEFVKEAAPEDLTLFLVSGGGSAVVETPAEGLRSSEISRTTRVLLSSGAPIQAMNVVRRHISQLKGGRLAIASGSARFATLALSDVVGDAPEDIASGPTAPDPTTFHDAVGVVLRFGLARLLPTQVLRHLEDGARGRVGDTPKPGDSRFRRAPFVLVGSNRWAIQGAVRAARAAGYRVAVAERPIVGETRSAAARFARRLLQGPSGLAGALIGGGETTVVLGAHPGRGGRNQEFVLAAAHPLSGRNALVLSAGTDGIDGPTDAAGGWVDGESWARGQNLGVEISRALARHASYDALARLGSLLRTGPTGTNVMDLHVGLVARSVNRSRAGNTTPGAAPSNRRRSS